MDEIREFSRIPWIRCQTCGSVTSRFQNRFDELMEEKRAFFESFYLEIFTALVSKKPGTSVEEFLTQRGEGGQGILSPEDREYLANIYQRQVAEYIGEDMSEEEAEKRAYFYLILARLYLLLEVEDDTASKFLWHDMRTLGDLIYTGIPDEEANKIAREEADRIAGELFNYFVTQELGVDRICCFRTLMTPIILSHGAAVDLDPEVDIGQRMSELKLKEGEEPRVRIYRAR